MNRVKNLEIILNFLEMFPVLVLLFCYCCFGLKIQTHIIKPKVLLEKWFVTILWCFTIIPMTSMSFAILTSWTTTASKWQRKT